MILATWNVNSLKIRQPQVLEWLTSQQPDVLCLQETKLTDGSFIAHPFTTAGYDVAYSGQPSYNGVALLSRQPCRDVVKAIPDFDDEQKRVLAATLGDTRVICVYVPNGQSLDSDKYRYKLNWLEALTRWLRDELARYPRLALLGDLNIAPEDRDVHDPDAWQGSVLVSDAERQAFRGLLNLGFKDGFRLFDQPPGVYSWWDYRMAAFRRNMGLRIDHILLSDALAENCKSCTIDKAARKHERPSDHAPVLAVV
ncbi:MAG: exodeoxyribonuclease III [Burkholderiales bacterium]